jgi:hypothetical protein
MRERRHRRYGLVVFLWAIILWASRAEAALVVSELMYHPVEDAVTQDETLEFVELYNTGAVSEELGGWAFTNGITYVFEPNTLLGPKSHVVIARDPDAVMAAYGITGVLGPFSGRLNNDGERIELSNANGATVISLRYGAAHPWPVSPDGAGHSLTLAKFAGDPEDPASWTASTYIGGTPGKPDQVQAQTQPQTPTQVTLVDTGTPGKYFKGTKEPSPGPAGEATTAWTKVDFDDSGWLDGPGGYGYSSDSTELQWVRTQLNDMNGKYISAYARLRFTLTDEQVTSFSQLQAEVHYDDGFVLYLNGTRVAANADIVGNPPAFNAGGGAAGEALSANVDLMAQKDLLVAGTNVLAVQVHNATLSGSSDCFVGVSLRGVVEPAGTGGDARARVLVNEILANSDLPPGTDWIELYNPGPPTVDLGNVYLSDDPAHLLQYKIPSGTVLQPGRFWAIRQGTAPSGFPFALDFSGETVYVTAATAGPQPKPLRVLDAFRYGNMEPDATFGRFPDGSDYLDRLTSPTFAGANAQHLVRDIVINEIMYQHALRDERYEYVELYNRGTSTVSLEGWAFTDGIEYTFGENVALAPGAYLVVAQDPNFLSAVYNNLVLGANLVGPYTGSLQDHRDRLRLSYPLQMTNPKTGRAAPYLVTADEVTYCDGGRWPKWADGMGASLELRDPRGDNDSPEAWADSDESAKTRWQQFSFTISGGDNRYTRDTPSVFDFLLLNAGEVLLDDLELITGGSNCLTNSGFEGGESPWRILGNHTRSFLTTEDRHSGARALHLIATGHGDPGANRINQSISGLSAGDVTFRGWARWLRGSRFLLLRTTRERSPVMPPRPAHAFELEMPLDLGTPGRQNTAFVANRGPDIRAARHAPAVPAAGEPILVTARVTDNDGVQSVTLFHRAEGTGGAFTSVAMPDDGAGDDEVAGDGLYTAVIPGSTGNSMQAFYIEASDGTAATRFPTKLEPSAEVPERTCLVRVGDPAVSTPLALYRVWMSDEAISIFRSRPNLSNELLDCTFVYNDSEVFYNCGIRYRGSPFLRSGSGRDPRERYAYRIDFRPDQKFRAREEMNLDNTELNRNGGPLQERAAYWFYGRMGLQYSRQEWPRLVINGRVHGSFDDVQKIDGDYIDAWFPGNNEGYIHKIDDYFEYNAQGTSYTNIDEGLLSDSQHPLVPETYRWHFEKRSHPEDDNWQHLYELAVALNTPATHPRYETIVEARIDPNHFAKVLAIRHAVGDWDSYGYTRGKNNAFYYALPEGKWYLLPWDIDFAFGAGDGTGTSLFRVTGEFPEVIQFLNYPKYKQAYFDAFAELVNGPWKTSYGTNDPPTAFDRYLDENAAVLMADGQSDGRRDQIKQFVRYRREYILSQLPTEADKPPSGRPPRQD